jgi:hypothetical protein
MSWPSPVAVKQAATANQYNALLASLQTWGGQVDAANNTIKNLGGFTFASAAIIDATVGGLTIKGGCKIIADLTNTALILQGATGSNVLQVLTPESGGALVSFTASVGFSFRSADGSRAIRLYAIPGQEEYIGTASGRLRIPGSFDVDTDIVAGGKITAASLTVTNPTNIVLGANWVNWTPVVATNAPMTVTNTSLEHAYYLRVGPIVFFSFGLVITFGGSPAAGFSVTLPVAPFDALSHICSSLIFQGGLVVLSTAQSSGSQVNLFSNTALTVGVATSVRVQGFYKCA